MQVQRTDRASRRLVHPAARLAHRRERLVELAARLTRCWSRLGAHRRTSLSAAQFRLLRELRAPLAQSARLATAQRSLAGAGQERIARATRRLGELQQSLAHLNPQAVLERGYAIVLTPDEEIVVDSAQLKRDDIVTLTLARGRAAAIVTSRD